MEMTRPAPKPLTDAQAALAAQWIPLVRKLVGEAAGSSTDFDDLFGVASEAVMRAARSFKPDKGWTFQALATRCVKNAICDVRRRKKCEVELKDWHVERGIEVAPKRRQIKPNAPVPLPVLPACPGRFAAIEALRCGKSYRQARAEAAKLLPKPPSMRRICAWAREAGIQPRCPGRPPKVDPIEAARWLRASTLAEVSAATGVSICTLSRVSKMFRGVRRLRRIFRHDSSKPATGRNNLAPIQRSLGAE